jgi:hypothetical protein
LSIVQERILTKSCKKITASQQSAAVMTTGTIKDDCTRDRTDPWKEKIPTKRDMI